MAHYHIGLAPRWACSPITPWPGSVGLQGLPWFCLCYFFQQKPNRFVHLACNFKFLDLNENNIKKGKTRLQQKQDPQKKKKKNTPILKHPLTNHQTEKLNTFIQLFSHFPISWRILTFSVPHLDAWWTRSVKILIVINQACVHQFGGPLSEVLEK